MEAWIERVETVKDICTRLLQSGALKCGSASEGGARKNWWELEREWRSQKRQSAESAAHLSLLRSQSLRVPV